MARIGRGSSPGLRKTVYDVLCSPRSSEGQNRQNREDASPTFATGTEFGSPGPDTPVLTAAICPRSWPSCQVRRPAACVQDAVFRSEFFGIVVIF